MDSGRNDAALCSEHHEKELPQLLARGNILVLGSGNACASAIDQLRIGQSIPMSKLRPFQQLDWRQCCDSTSDSGFAIGSQGA